MLNNYIYRHFFNSRIIDNTVVKCYVIGLLNLFCNLAFFVRGGSVCLILQHINSCLTFAIMCCDEEYCDMHQ